MFNSKHVKQTTFPVNMLNLCSFLIMIVGTKCCNSKVLLQIALFTSVSVKWPFWKQTTSPFSYLPIATDEQNISEKKFRLWPRNFSFAWFLQALALNHYFYFNISFLLVVVSNFFLLNYMNKPKSKCTIIVLSDHSEFYISSQSLIKFFNVKVEYVWNKFDDLNT